MNSAAREPNSEKKEEKAENSSSYGQIFRSSSIMGGAQGIGFLVGLVRVKVVAALLGTSGVGLVGLYTSAIALMGTVSELGMRSSGVREIADARSSNDEESLAKAAKALFRLFLLTGLLVWLLTAILSVPLSRWTFGSSERAWSVAILGATVLLNNISGAQTTLLQGVRRVGDVARVGVIGAIGGAIIAVGIYSWLGERGIIPALIATAVVNLGISSWFARKVNIKTIPASWGETLAYSKRIINLGVTFMYGALLVALVGLVIRGDITKTLGLESAGIYHAAWNISVMFASFIIGAMAVDFFPRLTEVANDNEKVNSLVNEQMEIGMLLILPGVVVAISFGQLIIQILYTKEFSPSADLLPWLMCGVFGQIASMPMGFIQKVKAKIGWIYFGQSHLNVIHIGLALVLLRTHGLIGVAWAFAIATFFHGFVTYLIAKRLSDFECSAGCLHLLVIGNLLLIVSLVVEKITTGPLSWALGFVVSAITILFSLRGISSRLGESHKIIQLVLRVPGGRHLCGLA